MKYFSWVLFIIGGLLFLSSFLPPLFYWYWSWLIRPPVLFDPDAVSIYPIPKILTEAGLYADLPLTDSKDWFPQAKLATVSASPVDSFLLTFPSLKISDIEVTVNGSNLKFRPIHFPGSALPGQIGNTVILGHSALPQFYFLKSSLTVFNPLLKLKIGDEIEIDFNNLNYSYKINKIFEVTPDKVEVLSQSDNHRQLTLITCVPLGTYLRRLVLVGDLIN